MLSRPRKVMTSCVLSRPRAMPLCVLSRPRQVMTLCVLSRPLVYDFTGIDEALRSARPVGSLVPLQVFGETSHNDLTRVAHVFSVRHWDVVV